MPRVAGEGDHVVHNQEVAGEILVLDHRQFAFQPSLGLTWPVGIAALHSHPAQLAQPTGRGEALGHLLPGQLRLGQLEVERALLAQPDRGGHRPGKAGEPLRHLVTRPQMGARRWQPAVHLSQAASGPDRGHRRRQPVLNRGGEVHVVGRHQGQVLLGGQGGQGVVDDGVAGQPGVVEFHRDVVGAETVDESPQLGGGGLVGGPGGPARLGVPGQGGPDRPLTAAGQDLPMAVGGLGELVQVVDRAALLVPAELGGGDRRRQPVVALDPPSQHQQMPALRVGHPVLRGAQAQRQFGAVHGGQVVGQRCLGEPRRGVQPVVIGQGQPGQPQPDPLLDQRLGVAGPVQEAEVGVRVQLRVGDVRLRRCVRPGLRYPIGRPLV